MREQTITCVGESLANAAMTMAFVSLDPAAPSMTCDTGMRLIRIPLRSPQYASVELLAPEHLGALIASNMLACDPADEMAASRAEDALKELLNVATGDLLRRAGFAPGAEMGLPELVVLDGPAEARCWLDAGPHEAFDAEGHFTAIRLLEVT